MGADEDHSPVGTEQRQQVLDWREITVSFRFVTDVERIQASAMPLITYDEPTDSVRRRCTKLRWEEILLVRMRVCLRRR